MGLQLGGTSLVKALGQANDGFVACGFAPAEQTHQGGVQAGDVGVDKARRAAPDADDHLFDELFGSVAPVGAGLGQQPALKFRPASRHLSSARLPQAVTSRE